MMSPMTDYEQDLNDWLKDPEFAAGYLNAAIEEGDKEAIMLAMRRVAQARGGMATVAQRAHVKRENLYRMLSKRGNPALHSLFNILHGMGLKLTVQPETVRDCPNSELGKMAAEHPVSFHETPPEYKE